MESNVEVWKFGFQVLEFLLTCGIGIYVYLTNQDKVTNERIGKLEDDFDRKFESYGERIAKIETKADAALTHGDLSELHEKINDVSGEVKTLTGEFNGVRNLLSMINEHLMKGGKS